MNHILYVSTTKDDVRMIFDKMSSADIIIFATPVYLMNKKKVIEYMSNELE